METYKLIRQLREEKDLTQQEVANALKLNLSVYKKIELGSRPIRETELSNIADFFNVTTDFLLGRTSPITDSKIGDSITSHFRLNTANMDIDDIEELEEELTDYMEFLIKKAKEKKARRDKK